MLSFFTVVLIAAFVLMTWFETPVEPLVRHQSADEEPAVDAESTSDREAA